MMNCTINSLIFDLGGVLIDWNPEYVFLEAFQGDRKKMEWFFENICTSSWNEEQDAGYPLEKATEERILMFPEHESMIRMYYGKWEEMLGGPIQETVQLLQRLIAKKQFQILALTNWSAETFPIALERYSFLHWFEDIVVSGEEKTRKPFPDIYQKIMERNQLKPKNCLFIDDNIMNVQAARQQGMHAIRFTSATALKNHLKLYGIQVD